MLCRAKSLVISLMTLALVQNGASAGQLTDQGRHLYDAGQYEKAGAYFAAEIKANPNDPTANYLLGNVFVKLNRTAEAMAAYQKAISIEPNGNVGVYGRQALESLSNSAKALPTRLQTPAVTAESKTVEEAPPDENVQRINAECEKMISQIEESAEQRIRTLRADMNERIAANGEKRTLSLGPDVTTTRYDPTAANESIKEEMQPQIKFIEDDAKRQIAAVKAAYNARLAPYQKKP